MFHRKSRGLQLWPAFTVGYITMRCSIFLIFLAMGFAITSSRAELTEGKTKLYEADLGVLDTRWERLQVYDGLRAVHTEPPSTRRMSVQGEVIAVLLVNERGVVQEVHVERSSGNDGLDQAAVSARKKWKYKARQKDERYVTVQPMVFSPVNF